MNWLFEVRSFRDKQDYWNDHLVPSPKPIPQDVLDAEFIHYERLRVKLEGDFAEAFPVITLKMI